jgi:hypothetical protein
LLSFVISVWWKNWVSQRVSGWPTAEDSRTCRHRNDFQTNGNRSYRLIRRDTGVAEDIGQYPNSMTRLIAIISVFGS